MKQNVPNEERNKETGFPAIIAKIVKRGGIVVLPTDTLYGICASALQKKAVDRLYAVRDRDRAKPFIILIPSLASLKIFGVRLEKTEQRVLRALWPGKISVILPITNKKFSYLHRGTKTIAFRIPNSSSLRALLVKTGPLAAPSANPEGKTPATTLAKAENYFGASVDLYVDGGIMRSKPSTLIALRNGEIAVLRKGAVRI